MNKTQNYNNKQKDNRIRELELENSLLRQRLSMINNISNYTNSVNDVPITQNTNEKVIIEKRIVDSKCIECGKPRTNDKSLNWFVDKSGFTYCEHCFRIIFPNDYSHWQGKHTNPFAEEKGNETETDKDNKEDSFAEHLKK